MSQTIFESNNNRVSQTLLNYNLLFREKRNKSLKRILHLTYIVKSLLGKILI